MTNTRSITGLTATSRRRALSGCGAAILLSLAFGISPACADLAQAHHDCANAPSNPDLGIAACSALLRSGADSVGNTAVSYLKRGSAWDAKGDHDRAIADFSQALVINPNLAGAFHGRGLAYGRKGDTDRAIADLGRAIQLNPSYVSAYVNRAFAFYKKGHFDLAIADASAALRINPGLVSAYVRRGAAYAAKGQFEAALADANNAIRLDPRLAAARNLRGTVEIDLGQMDAAFADLNEAIWLDPQGTAAYVNRAQAFEQQNRRDAALADFAMALRIDPNQSDALAGQARINARINARQSAVPPAPMTVGLASTRPAAPVVASSQPKSPVEAPKKVLVAMGQTANVPDTTGSITASMPAAVPAPAATPAAPAHRSLDESLAACAKLAGDGAPLFVDTDDKTRVTFPACYRGRSHLECTMKALTDEAADIDREYGEIVRVNYSDIRDVAAVCRLPTSQLDAHFTRAKSFDARVKALTKAFQASSACMMDTAEAVRKVDLRTQKGADALMTSMLDNIREPVVQAGTSHQEVLKLVNSIADSQKSIATIRNVRRVSCR